MSPPPRPVHPTVERLAGYAWRLLAIAALAIGVSWLLARLRIVVLPLLVALFLTVILAPPARWLRQRGWSALLSTWAVFVGFAAATAIAGLLIVPAAAAEFGRLGPTMSQAVDDLETWLIEESPFDLDQPRLDGLRADLGDAVKDLVGSSGGVLLRGAVVAAEVLAGAVLALVLTFFFVKDGPRFQTWALRHVPEPRRDLTRRLAARAWQTLGAYLRGAATLGVVEAAAIGITLAAVGGRLVLPVMLLTIMAAFVPFVGAIVAGAAAVSVALVTAGVVPALIVAAVALVVQQLDNDLLAPLVFGKALNLHPVVILLAVAGGTALGGLPGAFVAVPAIAVASNVVADARTPREPAGGEGKEDVDGRTP